MISLVTTATHCNTVEGFLVHLYIPGAVLDAGVHRAPHPKLLLPTLIHVDMLGSLELISCSLQVRYSLRPESASIPEVASDSSIFD